MKILIEFEIPESHAKCFCNDEDRISSVIGHSRVDFKWNVVVKDYVRSVKKQIIHKS